MLRTLIIAVIALYSLQLSAAEAGKPDLSRLQAALRGGTAPDSIKPSAIPGLYEVTVGSQVLYLSEDGRYAIDGDMIDLAGGNNLTEARRDELRLKAIEAIGEENMVVFAPTAPAKHTVTVFTDIDCVYCRKLHSEIADYNRNGIVVRYLMYPRAGLGSDSYDKAVSMWCAEDRRDALTRAKRGEAIPSKSCPNPIKEQYELGQAVGVQGTPSIILENGKMLPGYVPAARLAQILDSGGAIP